MADEINKTSFDAMAHIISDRVRDRIGDRPTYNGEDGLLHCATCGGKLQTEIELGGMTVKVYCICRCIQDEVDKDEINAMTRALAAEIEVNRRESSCGIDLDLYDFGLWEKGRDDRALKILDKYCDDFKIFQEAGEGLCLYGQVGVGKTFAAGCIVNRLTSEGYKVYMTNVPSIVAAVQADMSRRQEYLDKLARYDLLIIDDLTVERATDYVTEIAQEVIDARYRTKRPMIITTNADISVQDSVSIERQRMFRRIKDRCHMVEIHDRLSAIRVNAEPEDKLKRRALLGL